jgi:hypothetical protein
MNVAGTKMLEIEVNHSVQIQEPRDKGRFFIPVVSVYTEPELLKAIMSHTSWIGFNYLELRNSNRYPFAKARGLRDAFGLDDQTRIFLSTTAKDKRLVRFYDESNGLEKFRSDMLSFGVDLTMGPDWFSYKDDPLSLRQKVVRKSIKLNMDCLDLENLAPTIRGTNFQEMAGFISHFRVQGKKVFVFPGREYLINLADRKRAQREAFSLTATLTRAEGIKLILTGCSSPKLQQRLFAVWGFAGQGWLIQSMQRRLIKDETYVSIFNKRFFCDDPRCCASISINDLKSPRCDSIRAIHNLRRINAALKPMPKIEQTCLEEF